MEKRITFAQICCFTLYLAAAGMKHILAILSKPKQKNNVLLLHQYQSKLKKMPENFEKKNK